MSDAMRSRLEDVRPRLKVRLGRLDMQANFLHRIILRWLVGLIGSWIIVYLVGPWIVNSILVRTHEPSLDTIMLRPGDTIRWRSEGFGTTHVGDFGLPGWQPLQTAGRIVLWGDSQVEGFCVDDADKIANQCVRLMDNQTDFLPIARSGTDAFDWSQRITAADSLWHPQFHVWIVTELSDLVAISNNAKQSGVGTWSNESSWMVRGASAVRGDALFQAMRNVLLDPSTGGLRSLRWSIGPHGDQSSSEASVSPDENTLTMTAADVIALNQILDGRLLVVYAPGVPRIDRGVVTDHPDDEAWETLSAMLRDEVAIVDMRPALIERSATEKRFPRGFDNGTPSYGHLNEFGNRIIAQSIVNWLRSREREAGGSR